MNIKSKVLLFLKENSKYAFTASEIAEAIDENKTTVSMKIVELEDEQKIERKIINKLIHNRYIGE